MAFSSSTKAPAAVNNLQKPQGTSALPSTSGTRHSSFKSASNHAAHSTNTKKRSLGDDELKAQPQQKKPLIGGSIWGAKTGGIQPRAPKTYTQRMVNDKLMPIDAIEKAKREAAEQEAKTAKAAEKFRKDIADELVNDLTKGYASFASTTTVSHEPEKIKRAEICSTIEASGTKDAVEKVKEEPPKRRSLIKGRRPENKSETSTPTSITTAQKVEKRKIVELSSDDDEPVQYQSARKRQMAKSERRDIEKKPEPEKSQKDEVIKRKKEKAQRARKAPENKNEEKKQQLPVTEKMTEEPLYNTNEEIVAWFAKEFPEVSEVSENISKVYLKKERACMMRDQARLDQEQRAFENSDRQRYQQSRLDKDFRNNETDNYPRLHHKRVEKRKAADEAAFQNLSKKARSDIYPPGFVHGVVASGNTSPASSASNARSTSAAASDQTGRTTPADADHSDKHPNPTSVSGSEPCCRPAVIPTSTFATPPDTPGLKWFTLSDLKQAPFNLEKSAEQIEKCKKDSNNRADEAEQEVKEHQDFVNSISRRDKADKELMATFEERKTMLEENVEKAKITQERYHPNISDVVFGKDVMRAWYNSDYRKENLHKNAEKHLPKHPAVDTLYVCTNCFAYTANLEEHAKHFRTCENTVPGKKVYEHGDAGVWSVWEVDGQTTGAFCQNLSLFARLFLADKTVSYYTDHFDYFLLVHADPETGYKQIVGFFSKEKNSYDGNNLACILIFPLWQGMGLGKMLMGISYEISRMEGTIGGPERPFSSLGEKSYKRYWQAELARWILTHPTTDKKKGCGMVNIQRISRETCILERDCIDTINSMELGILPKYTGPDYGQPVVLDKEKVRQWVKTNNINLDRVVDARGFLKTFEKRKAIEEDEEDD